MRTLFASVLLSLVLALPAQAAIDAKFAKCQLPGDLTQAQAEIVLKGALAKAVDQGVPMNIAVVDAGGNLKAFMRMDGAFLGSIDISIGKAETARLFNMSSADLGKAAQPGGELYGIEVTNDRLRCHHRRHWLQRRLRGRGHQRGQGRRGSPQRILQEEVAYILPAWAFPEQ